MVVWGAGWYAFHASVSVPSSRTNTIPYYFPSAKMRALHIIHMLYVILCSGALLYLITLHLSGQHVSLCTWSLMSGHWGTVPESPQLLCGIVPGTIPESPASIDSSCHTDALITATARIIINSPASMHPYVCDTSAGLMAKLSPELSPCSQSPFCADNTRNILEISGGGNLLPNTKSMPLWFHSTVPLPCT